MILIDLIYRVVFVFRRCLRSVLFRIRGYVVTKLCPP